MHTCSQEQTYTHARTHSNMNRSNTFEVLFDLPDLFITIGFSSL